MQRKYCGLPKTAVLKLQFLETTKQSFVIKTTVLQKTAVLWEYIENTLLPNGATVLLSIYGMQLQIR